MAYHEFDTEEDDYDSHTPGKEVRYSGNTGESVVQPCWVYTPVQLNGITLHVLDMRKTEKNSGSWGWTKSQLEEMAKKQKLCTEPVPPELEEKVVEIFRQQQEQNVNP